MASDDVAMNRWLWESASGNKLVDFGLRFHPELDIFVAPRVLVGGTPPFFSPRPPPPLTV